MPNGRMAMALLRRSPHWTAAPSLGAAFALSIWLVFGLRFDLQSSPVWQFIPYGMMLVLTIAACSLMGTFPAFRYLGRLQFLLPLIVFLLLAVFLIWDWTHSGPYTSIRDDRYFPAVVRASAASVMGFSALGLLQAVLMATLLVGRRMGWCWVSRIPWPQGLLPLNRSPGIGDPVEGEAGYGQADQEECSSYGQPYECTPPVPHSDGSAQDNQPRHSHESTEDEFRMGEKLLKNHPSTFYRTSQRSSDIEGKD